MKVRSKILSAHQAMLLAGTVSIAAIPWSGAFGADQPVLKAPVPEVVTWYFFGGFEAGVRFVDEPPSGFGRAPPPDNWLTPRTTDSRAKFEEYGEVRDGLFLDWINLQAGTTDGRYAFDFWGRSVGRNNQSYNVDAAAIGYHYLSLGWDETPHLISTSAKTLFGGVGTTFLTVADPVQAALQPQLPAAALNTPAGAAARANIEAIINDNLGPLELSTHREKATADYRFTPTPDTDVVVNYSHEKRTGVRPVGVPYGFGGAAPVGFASNTVEAPQPIDDRTQNVSARGEYVGTTLWGTRWTTALAYSGSFYENNLTQLDIENPFCLTCNPLAGTSRAPRFLRLALAPDNHANAVTWNTAVNLPFWNARYVSTVQYNAMRQNDPFVDASNNGIIALPITFAGVPVASLDGKVDAFLWNNVLTAQITKDLKLTVRGRHYDIENNTPSLHIDNWIRADGGCASGAPSPITGLCPAGNPRNSLPISYTKDNASAELNWRAARWATFGGGFFWERYDRDLRDVNVTDEYSGRVFANITPTEQILARASYLHAERRYDHYSTEEFVEIPGLQFSEVVSNMRRFDVANRDRHKAEAAIDWSPAYFITISPNAGLRWDTYPDDVFNPLGVLSDHSWNAGVELAIMVNPSLKLMASYNYEDRTLDMAGGSGGANFNTGNVLTGCSTDPAINPDHFLGTACTWRSDINQKYHTVMGAADWKVVPSRFDLRVEYLYARATEANVTTPCTAPGFACNGLTAGVDPAAVNFGQFPPERTDFQRFNVIGKYYVDPSLVRQLGWKGDVVVKARYTWERNDTDNWAVDNLTPYVPTPDTIELSGGSRSLFLAAFNPNYTAQLVALAVQVKW